MAEEEEEEEEEEGGEKEEKEKEKENDDDDEQDSSEGEEDRRRQEDKKIEDPIQPKEGECVDDWIDRVFVFGDMMVFSDEGSVVVAEAVDLEDEEEGCVSVQFYG